MGIQFKSNQIKSDTTMRSFSKLTKELGKSSSSTSTSALSLTRSISSNSSNSSNIYGYGNVTSDDSSLQSTNTARRRFQRRGSKEPSQRVQQQTLSMNDQMIPNDSCRIALTSLSLDESTFSSDCMEDSFNLGEFSG